MPDLTQAVTTIANLSTSPVGPVPVFTRPSTSSVPAPLQAAATCDVCSCRVSQCSGGRCCF